MVYKTYSLRFFSCGNDSTGTRDSRIPIRYARTMRTQFVHINHADIHVYIYIYTHTYRQLICDTRTLLCNLTISTERSFGIHLPNTCSKYIIYIYRRFKMPAAVMLQNTAEYIIIYYEPYYYTCIQPRLRKSVAI